MAVQAKTGSFTCTTGAIGTTQAITGVGFTPRAVIFWTNQRTDVVDAIGAQNFRGCIGAAVSATDRRFGCALSNDAQATSVCKRGNRDDACFGTVNTTPAFAGIMDLQSMDSDGFTLVVDQAFAAAITVFYLAIGGDSISNIATGGFLCPTSTGNYDITSLTFQPTAVLFFGSPQNSTGADTGDDERLCIGAATSSSDQAVAGISGIDGAGTMDTTHYGLDSVELYTSRFDSSAQPAGREAFVSFLSTGFRLNHLEGGQARSCYFLAMDGVSAKVGNMVTSTSAGPMTAVTGLGFAPAAVLFFSNGSTENTQDAATASAKISIGASAGTAGIAMGARDQDNVATSNVATAIEFDNVYVNINDSTATIDGSMAIQSMDSGGFTTTMTDADPTARWVGYLALGPAAPPASVVSWIEDGAG